MSPFPPQVVFITGAGSGLGRELAVQLAQAGSAIAAVDRVPGGLHSLEESLQKDKRRIATAIADVTDGRGLRDVAARLEQQLGPIELLIANAGIGLETSALALSAADMASVIQVNLIGVSNSIAAVLPGMLERRRGHIAAISSVASFRGIPRMLGYCASKAGVNALLEGLRVEVKPHGIAVTTICPGWIRTPMTAQVKGPMPGMLEVRDAARHILEALRKRRAFFAFPRSLVWRLRLVSWLPTAWSDWLVSKMVPATDER